MPFPKGSDGKPTRATALAWAKAIVAQFGQPPYTPEQLFGVPKEIPPEIAHDDSEYAIAEMVSDFVTNWKPYLVEEKKDG